MIKLIVNTFLMSIVFVSLLFGQNNFGFKINFDAHKYFEKRNIEIIISKGDKQQYKIQKKLAPYLSVPEVGVFENGNFVLIFAVEGILEFYSNGIIKNKTNIIDDDFYDESSILFNVDGNKIALLTTVLQRNKILLFNNSGDKLFEKEINIGLGSGVAFSDKNNLLVASINNWDKEKLVSRSIFTDYISNTETIFHYKFEKGFFNKNSLLFLGQSNNELFLLDLTANKVLWDKKTNANTIFIQSKIGEEEILVAETPIPKLINGKWKYEEVKINSYNLIGTKKHIKTITKQFETFSIIGEQNNFYIKLDDGIIK